MHGRDTRRYQQNQGGNYSNYGYSNGRSGGAPRNHVVPTEPPFTAYVGNAPETMVQGDFEQHLFDGLKVKQVRLVRDRQTDRFRGFAYVDFEDADSLRKAIELDGTCINDRPIRIDVAARPLGAGKSEGFRNKPGFDHADSRRHPPGNNNRSSMGYRQGGRNNNNFYNQPGNNRNANNEYEDNQYNDEQPNQRNRHSSGSGKSNERHPSQTQITPGKEQNENESPPRHASIDDVFVAPDTPASTEDGADSNQDDTNIVRQHSRNWADCPIDESVVETTSPPPSANNTFTSDDFQVVRNKNNKSRSSNQHSSSRSMNNSSNRGRNYHQSGPSQMSTGREYYDQMPRSYGNQPQQFYHQHGSSYQQNNQRHQNSAGGRQRHNSNRSTNSRSHLDDNNRSTRTNDFENNSAPAENRPRLQLLPRSQKQSSTTETSSPVDSAARNASIFGSGKPRDERDPKLVELNKHIEEVVEKEQHTPRTKSTTSIGSNEGVTKPVRILSATTKSLVDH